MAWLSWRYGTTTGAGALHDGRPGEAKFLGTKVMKEISKRKVLLAVGDTVLAIGIFQLGYFLRLGSVVNILEDYTGATLFCVLALLVNLHIFDLYDYRQHGSLRQYLPGLLRAMIVAFALSVAFFYFSNNWRFGRGAFLISVALLAPSLALWRMVAYRLTVAARPKRVAIVGTGASARAIYDTLSSAADQYDIIGFVSDDGRKQCQSSLPAVVLGFFIFGRARHRGPDLHPVGIPRQPVALPPLAVAAMQGEARAVDLERVVLLPSLGVGRRKQLHAVVAVHRTVV